MKLNVGKYMYGNVPVHYEYYPSGMYVDKRKSYPLTEGKGLYGASYTIRDTTPSIDEDDTSSVMETGFSLPINSLMRLADLHEAPDRYKNIGSAGLSTIDSSCKVMYRLDKVDDIESCAQYYHRNGYLVNEYLNEETDLFTYVNTRYYYNVVKMSDIDVHIKNGIESEELMARIALRLLKGIRLWNVSKGDIGNFLYDNVEKKYIKEA